MLTEIKRKYPDEEAQRQEVAKYYINTHPNASWAHIAGQLLQFGHKTLSAELKNKIKEENGKCSIWGHMHTVKGLSPHNLFMLCACQLLL